MKADDEGKGLPPPDAVDSEGNPLWKRESVEEPLEPFFRSVFTFGPRWLNVLVWAAALVLLIAGLVWTGWLPMPYPHEQSGHHASDGSPKKYGGNTSWLKSGAKDDSLGIIQDGRLDGIGAVMLMKGCGRKFYTTDPDGWAGRNGRRETHCNNRSHETGQKWDGGKQFGLPSYHYDLILLK